LLFDAGASNTASTLNYFIVMRSNTFIYCIIVAVTILITKFVIEESSSPVEEMYHAELVNTLDSILDSRCINNTTFSCDSVCECME